MQYLAILAGDGSFYSVVKDSLEDAIAFVRNEFEDDSGWVDKYLRDEDNWSHHFNRGAQPSRVKWDGEQGYFEIIAIVGDGRPTLKDAIEAARGGPAPTPLKGFA